MEEDEELELNGEINTRVANQKVWLVKIPNFLFDLWENSKDNEELGEITVIQQKNIQGVNVGEPSITFQMKKKEESLNQEKKIPEEYAINIHEKIDFKNQAPKFQIFSEDTQGSLAFEGVVNLRCEIQPPKSDEYIKLCRERTKKSEERTKVIKPYEEANIKRPIFKRPQNKEPSKKIKTAEPVKIMDENVLTDELFKLYNTKHIYTFSELSTITKQPSPILKKVLNKICFVHKKGAERGKYELKEEYKSSKQREIVTEQQPNMEITTNNNNNMDNNNLISTQSRKRSQANMENSSLENESDLHSTKKPKKSGENINSPMDTSEW